jgi:hypothetical protein
LILPLLASLTFALDVNANTPICNAIANQKLFAFSGTTHGGANEFEQDPFQMFVELSDAGGGTLHYLRRGSGFRLVSEPFHELALSSPVQELGVTQDTVGDLWDIHAAQSKRLRIFDHAFREGGDIAVTFIKIAPDGTKLQVAQISSILGQRNSFKGQLRRSEPGNESLSFYSLPYRNMELLSFSVALQDGSHGDITINPAAHTITLSTLNSAQEIYFSRSSVARGIDFMQQFIFLDPAIAGAGRTRLSTIHEVFRDLHSERFANIKFYSKNELVFELSNDIDKTTIGGLVGGSIFPERHISGKPFTVLAPIYP